MFDMELRKRDTDADWTRLWLDVHEHGGIVVETTASL